MAIPSITYSELCLLAGEVGLSVAGVVPWARAGEELSARRRALAVWQEEGFAGEMEYMRRAPSLFVDLRHFLPSIESVVGFVVSYRQGDPAEAAPGYGRVARYAWGRDYHRVLKKRLGRLVAEVSRKVEGVEWRTFTDAVPLLERALLSATGTGFIGNNTMFIVPGIGSFTFLAEILWNLDVLDLPDVPRSKGGCGTCRRCLDDCPTAAFTAARQLDARRCISYLTIEKKTAFTDWERQALGNWVFGCDVCQEVCPFNHSKEARTGMQEFQAASGAGAFLDLRALLRLLSQEEFSSRFQGTAIMRAGRASMLRNASCVIANTRYFPALPQLLYAAEYDPGAVVRESCTRALQVLAADADCSDKRKISNLLGKIYASSDLPSTTSVL